MPDDILNSMRGLREDMRQRLCRSAEYRALEALDAAIDEIGAILQEAPPVSAPAPVASEMPDRKRLGRAETAEGEAMSRLRPRRPS